MRSKYFSRFICAIYTEILKCLVGFWCTEASAAVIQRVGMSTTMKYREWDGDKGKK